MKFGSVKFYKRLIVAGFVVVVALPLVLAVVFGTLYFTQRRSMVQLEAVNWALAHGSDLPEGMALPADMTLPDLPPEAKSAPGAGASYSIGPSFGYQVMFPQLYAERPDVIATEEKICYLTFDDGPSENTRAILDTLEAYGVKATFFVTGEAAERYGDILRAAVEAGHTVGVHTYSHDYPEIYASVEAYLEDFARIHGVITEATGAEPTIFRFPGGSINVHNQTLYTELIAEMTRRGFVFFDWNAACSDAVAGGISQSEVTANVLNTTGGRQRTVVLLHDRLDNTATAAALPQIIEGLAAQGYSFAPLTAAVEPVTFFYPD